MKRRLITVLLTCLCASLARADFNPVALTPSSYTLNIVVPKTTVQGLPYCINVTAGNGTGLGDNTYYEQGLRARPGQVGANSGIPPHNTIFTNINDPTMTFVMPPDYTTNNTLMIDSVFPTGTLTFTTPATATNLAILCCGGGGAVSVGYTVTHADASTETGTLSLLDWFAGGAAVAWGANGRVTSGGGYNNFNASTMNNNPPFLYALTIPVSGSSPVVNVALTYSSGAHGNFFSVSGEATGAWVPIALDPSTFNVMGIVPAAVPFPVTGTMDQGTNLSYNDNLATWFEQGFVRTITTAGLPDGSFNSFSQPTHHYQFADFSGNNAILIDTNHQSANIGFAAPAAYSSLAFLTAGGNEGAPNIMSNICIIQHQDGVDETNNFLAYDWFDQQHNGSIALEVNGRVDMNARAVNSVGNQGLPYMFETYFLLNDTTSPVTNVLVQYFTAPSAASTTFIMAISGATGGLPAVVDSGPTPPSQTVVPGTNVTFTVGVSGTAPITGFWEVDNGGSFVPLTDGLDANGSVISGSQTFTLSISNVRVADGTNYQFVAGNAFGTNTSPLGALIVTPETVSITPANPATYPGNNYQLTAQVTAGPPLNYQWYLIDTSSVSNVIANATNLSYTINNTTIAMNGNTYGIIAWNAYGTNSASVVLSVSDSAAFLAGNLAPISGEAYAGATVTYAVNAQGDGPITYQWMTNGVVVSGLDSNRLTLSTPCGPTTIQVGFSNVLNGGVMVNSSIVQLQGDPNPLDLSLNTNGTGWQTNGSVPTITNNVLVLTDGGGGEATSAFYTNAQYVGGTWTASFIYNSHGGGADGTAFILQITNPAVVGGSGSELGYAGIAGNSLTFQINLYGGNNETIGIAIVTNGATGVYQATSTNVNVAGTNDILVALNWNTGVLAVAMTDLKTSLTYTTNLTVGPLVSLLGGNLAYIGFSGSDGGVSSIQTVRNFQFHSVLPAVNLSLSPRVGNLVVVSWPAADPTYVLQTNSSLTSANWGNAPAPTTVNGTNQVTADVTGGNNTVFYRLLRVTCQ